MIGHPDIMTDNNFIIPLSSSHDASDDGINGPSRRQGQSFTSAAADLVDFA